MKTKRRRISALLALVVALVMVLGMSVSVLAATNSTVTITDGNTSTSQYKAYKLFDLEVNDPNNPTAHKYTINSKYTNVLKSVTGKNTEADILSYLEGIKASASDTKAFSASIKKAIETAGLAADYSAANEVFSNVAPGYYLILETQTGTDDKADTYSLAILHSIYKDTTIYTKENTPTLEKKVIDVNDSTGDTTDWQDSADHDVGDVIEYKLTGTVSSHIADYKSYWYKFEDTLSAGLTFNVDSVKVYKDSIAAANIIPASNYVVAPTEDAAGIKFTVTFADLLKNNNALGITATSKIIVYYTCTLNENAVIGSAGNPNKALLKYENNPYREGDGEPDNPGETPEDKNIVFTYKVIVNKVDKEGKELTGAGFTLYKFDKETNVYVAVGAEQKGSAMTQFVFNRIDDGQYKIVETTVPSGYNKADDIVFYVVATHDTTSPDPKLTELKVVDANGDPILNEGDDPIFTCTATEGSIATDVINKTGVILPETGGMGTTIFTVVGLILAGGAAILLIARKRSQR